MRSCPDTGTLVLHSTLSADREDQTGAVSHAGGYARNKLYAGIGLDQRLLSYSKICIIRLYFSLQLPVKSNARMMFIEALRK